MRLGIWTNAALAWFSWALQAPIQADGPISLGREPSNISLPDTWQVLGPFQLGTRESVWGADPLERQGGFRNLQYDPRETFSSALAANGSVGWRIASAHYTSSANQASAHLNVNFPEIDWEKLQSVYGWPALQYQFWVRGTLDIRGNQAQTVALFGGGLLEFWVDGQLYFGADIYQYRRAPSILRLSPGHHVLDLRLTRDVRAFGALSHRFEVVIGAELRQEPVTIDKKSLLVSELAQGRLGGSWASINVQNNGAAPIDIVSVHSSKACHHLWLERPVQLHGYQTRPLAFIVTLGDAKETNFSVEVRFRTNSKAIQNTTFEVSLQERPLLDSQRMTYLHPSGIVSYAIVRPPPPFCNMTDGVMPIIVALHGAGLEADSLQARKMLDAAYGSCSWIIIPSGVTSWSGDDWHHWGTADIQAAISAIPDWAVNVEWEGPIPSQDSLIVTGHSNGGQGAWYFSTHYPDRVLAVAPVSGYSSIENYVPYTMWTLCEPLLLSVIQRARSTYKHESLLSNLAGIPIAQQHGSNDDNVPVYHARLMHTILDQIQWPSSYDELPGKGHWFEGVMTTSFLTKFYYAMVNRTNSARTITSKCPMTACNSASMAVAPWLSNIDAGTFTITVPASGILGSKAGIQVDQLMSPDVNGKLRVHCDPETQIWHIRTYNIYRFHLSRANLRINLPAAIMLDGLKKPFVVDSAQPHLTWYSKAVDGGWDILHESHWKTLGQRYGQQLGAADAILRTQGSFAILMCTSGVDQIALQISRNLMQYYAADSWIQGDCSDGKIQRRRGNVITLAIGEDLPRSKLGSFPIHTHRGGLVVFGNSPLSVLPVSSFVYPYEPGLGAVFLRPLENERLEMIIWGADLTGLQQAARLAPSLTGSGQPEYVILSGRCRWEGLAGVYSAGHFDRSWQVSSASYHSVDATWSREGIRVPS